MEQRHKKEVSKFKEMEAQEDLSEYSIEELVDYFIKLLKTVNTE